MSKIRYKIPRELLDSFITRALVNTDENGHLETLALVAGHWDGKNLVANDLIFPKQKGTSTEIEDLGKYNL